MKYYLDDTRRLILVTYITYSIREIRNAQQNFDQKTEGKRSLGRTGLMFKWILWIKDERAMWFHKRDMSSR
jgi:hypothetical protein